MREIAMGTQDERRYEVRSEIRPGRIAFQEAIGRGGAGIYRLGIAAAGPGERLFGPGAARPGRFVNVYLPGGDKLLPRPLSICDYIDDVAGAGFAKAPAAGDLLVLVYAVVGAGTEALSRMRAGDTLRVSTPLGHGYETGDLGAGSSALLVGGGLGIPPLLFLAKELRKQGVAVTAALGSKEAPILQEELAAAGATVRTAAEKGSVDSTGSAAHIGCVDQIGTVLDLLETMRPSADAWFACGPKPMLSALATWTVGYGIDPQLSLEERMGCGYGACLSCTCRTRTAAGAVVRKKICKDGPVFRASEIVFEREESGVAFHAR